MAQADIPSTCNIELIVREFYQTTSAERRQELHRSILQFQECSGSWTELLRWLRESAAKTDSHDVLFFATSCVQTKLLQDASDIISDNCKFEELRTLLLTQITNSAHSSAVRNSLAGCISALILQTIPDLWPHPFADLINALQLSSRQALCEIFGILPDMFRRFSVPVQRRNVVRVELQQQTATVADFCAGIIGVIQDVKHFEVAVRCILAWMNFTTDLTAWESIAFLVLEKISCSSAHICICSQLFCELVEKSELGLLPGFTNKLIVFAANTLTPLGRELLLHGSADEAEEIWQMICSLCEFQAKLILRSLDNLKEAQQLLVTCLDLLKTPGYYLMDESCSALPVKFWLTLYEELDFMEACDLKTGLTELLRPAYAEILGLVVTKTAIPKASTYASEYSAQEKEDFEQYRTDLSDLASVCFRFLGADCLKHLHHALVTVMPLQAENLEKVEAALFVMQAMADCVSGSALEQVALIFRQVLPQINLSSSKALTLTVLRLILRFYHVVIEYDCLAPVVEILANCLCDRITATFATTSLKAIVGNRDAKLLPYSDVLLSACYRCISTPSVFSGDRIRAVACVGYILSIQRQEFILSQLNFILTPALERLQAQCLSVEHGKRFDKEAALLELDLILALLGTLDTKTKDQTDEDAGERDLEASAQSCENPQPVLLVMSQCLPLFRQLYLRSAADKDIARKLCDMLKQSIGILLGEAAALLDSYREMVLTMFPPHSFALNVARQMVVVFGSDIPLQPPLAHFLFLIVKIAAKTLHETTSPEILEDFFGLMFQVAKKHHALLVRADVPSLLADSWTIALQALCVDNYPAATKASCLFLCEVLKHTDEPVVAEVAVSFGGRLVHTAFSRICVESLLSCVEHIADVLCLLLKAFPQFASTWLAEVSNVHPSVKCLFEETKNKRRFRELIKAINYERRLDQSTKRLSIMQALNFLQETPTVNWFNFVVDQRNLWTQLDRGDVRLEPSADQLIAQLVEQAQTEEKETRSPDVLPDDKLYCQKKAASLTILALKIWAHEAWSLPLVVENISPALQKHLLDELLLQTTGRTKLREIALSWPFEGNSPEVQFAVLLYCRWLLQVVVRETMIRPSPRLTVSNPMLQQDPSVAHKEACDAVARDAKKLCQTALEVLEKLCLEETLDFKILLRDCFCFPKMDLLEEPPNVSAFLEQQQKEAAPSAMDLDDVNSSDSFKRDAAASGRRPVVGHVWTELSEAVARNVFLRQLHYELGTFHFCFQRFRSATRHFSLCVSNMIEATQGPIDNRNLTRFCVIDMARLKGYCQALNVVFPSTLPVSLQASAPSVSSRCAELLSKKSSSKGLIECLTQDTIRHVVPSTIRQCESLRQAQLDATTATSLTALNELRSWKGFAWTLFKLARLLRDVSNVRHFCTHLKAVLAGESCRSFRDVAKVYLRFLCSMLPKLSGQLSSHDVLSLFDAADAAYIQSQKLKPFDVGELKMPHADFYEAQWELQCTYVAAKIRQLVPKCSYRVSSFWELPQGLQTATNRMPAGFLRDGCCVLIAKSQQLIALNETVVCGKLLAQAESDMQSTGADASVAFKLEDLRVRLMAWHNDFVRHTSATAASPITRQLTASVKAAVADAQKENAFQPSAEQLLQIASFLLNTREWEYLLGGCRNIVSRLVDFSKLIAALCYEIARNGDTIPMLTEELYKILILTLIDSVQIKRSATGQPISLARESNGLINRSQLMSYTRLLKEPLTLSVLMSFYVKTYNSTTLGVLNPIACEHLEFWPARAEEPTNLNVEYLCELIQICIGNATPTNAFCLRAAGDFYFGTSQSPSLALGYYLNAVLACTQGLTLNGLPANVVDATMIQRMAKCCAKCKCHTQEALLHQLMETPDFAAALKAFEQPDTYDATDEYYALIWDMNFLEMLVYALRKQNYEAKMDIALRCFECLELNAANPKEVLAIAAQKRRVYDMTSYVTFHPGGKALLRYAGRDATNAIASQPGHAFAKQFIYKKLNDFQIGTVD